MSDNPWHDGRDELDGQATRLRDRLNGYRRNVGQLPEHPERVHDAWATFLEASDTATDAPGRVAPDRGGGPAGGAGPGG